MNGQSNGLKNEAEKLNTSKNEASGDSAQPICKVKASIDSFFIELCTAICFVRVLLARAEIFTIYYRPFEVRNRYSYIASACNGALDRSWI